MLGEGRVLVDCVADCSVAEAWAWPMLEKCCSIIIDILLLSVGELQLHDNSLHRAYLCTHDGLLGLQRLDLLRHLMLLRL